MKDEIFVKGAKENNLKNIDVHIPRNTLTVFTGLSGSGKSTLAFDTICTRDFPIGGIRHLQKRDLQTFLQNGCSIRLMMEARKEEDRYAIAVVPTLIARDSLEANVPDNFNLTTLVGSTLGELKLYGQGAGALPTGNAVVSDLIAIARNEWDDAFVDHHLHYDASLLKGDYLLRENDRYQVYHDVTPQWMADRYREAMTGDAGAFWAKIPAKGE